MSKKIGVPKGTRDFGPEQVIKRNFLFNTIKEVFELHGFQPLETPSFENVETLTGKYGDEGDNLIFKILNSGNYLNKSKANLEVADSLEALSSNPINTLEAADKSVLNRLTTKISGKALRYDLTVPFARYVVMNQNEISFPFKRYQIQPVWRADRPAKGRYQEFYQCDVDVIGSNSLINEVELISIYDMALSRLGLTEFSILINNRKVLSGMADYLGLTDHFTAITVAIDKLDKIGGEKVKEELINKGIDANKADAVIDFISISGSNKEVLDQLKTTIGTTKTGAKGIEELEILFDNVGQLDIQNANIKFDIKLARGLNYYTGAIFEVTADNVEIGSIGGGGRYDDLTGIFGLKDMSGVGVSFGAARIFDVMEELALFKNLALNSSEVLISCFDNEGINYALKPLSKLRAAGIKAEVYPDAAKMKKQMKYANDKHIPYVIIIGSNEIETGTLSFKNFNTGEQEHLNIDQIIAKIKS
jgi:histidyl-tRNA synthetase